MKKTTLLLLMLNATFALAQKEVPNSDKGKETEIKG
jgi:hypothetical protein